MEFCFIYLKFSPLSPAEKIPTRSHREPSNVNNKSPTEERIMTSNVKIEIEKKSKKKMKEKKESKSAKEKRKRSKNLEKLSDQYSQIEKQQGYETKLDNYLNNKSDSSKSKTKEVNIC